MEDCLFCKIAQGQIPCDKVYEDERVLAFRDIAPQAPVHILVIPKKHLPNFLSLEEENDADLAHLMRAASRVARQEGLAQTGFRVVSNTGADARQSVAHLHLHILGGEQLSDRMA